tara:strand:+ start:16529 stop:17251 length:723 start_codon:yes stop_codon:yes gene_type:complete
MKNFKIGLVTGCNGELGIEIAKKLILSKFKIICHIRKKNKKFKDFEKKYKNNIISTVSCDLLNSSNLETQLNKITKKIEKLDVLVINAGTPYGNLFEMTRITDIKKIYEINFFSQILIIQKLLRLMKRSKSATIINISSLSSVIPLKGNIPYGGSKAALNFFTQILAKELKRYKIRVNALAPTILNNKMGSKTDPITAKTLLKNTFKKKPISMKIVTDKIMYLLSKNGHSINGKIIKVIK